MSPSSNLTDQYGRPLQPPAGGSRHSGGMVGQTLDGVRGAAGDAAAWMFGDAAAQNAGRRMAGMRFRMPGPVGATLALGAGLGLGALSAANNSGTTKEDIGEVAGSTAGSLAGAALGTPLGPVGMLAGSALGGLLGGGGGRMLGGMLSSEQEKARAGADDYLSIQEKGYQQERRHRNETLRDQIDAIADGQQRLRPELMFQSQVRMNESNNAASNAAMLNSLSGLLNSNAAAQAQLTSYAAGLNSGFAV